jgi:hypothetical protein
MIETKEFKMMLDKTSAVIPELLVTTTTKQEELAALTALLSMRLDLLETLAEEIPHPDFEENFRVVREKIYEVVKMISDRV